MRYRLTRTAVLACLLAAAAPATGQGEKLTRVEVGKRGKAATAFVDAPKGGTGTAFCVHPSGLFVTNEHVVRAAATEVILVLNPALDGERILKARVVRSDKDLDLALLRVEGGKDLPSLPLGTTKDVAELSDVVACGFPLGFALAGDKKNYPAISVNAGSVTALRHKNRELESIQIDVALTYGNSGGPVLDDAGRVIGVVVGGVAGGGKGINRAIPVSHLARFLAAPDVAFAPPELRREALGTPVEFKASLAWVTPGAPDAALKLVLRAGDEEPREFPMTKAGDAWVATAAPAGAGPARVAITARLGTATVSGLVEDAVFKVGGKPVRLSGVRRIDLGAKPGAMLADGRTTVTGEVTGLGPVEIDAAGQKLKVELARASQVAVEAAPEVATVVATVVAVAGGKEVARAERRLEVREVAARPTPADPASVPITPAAVGEARVEKRFPDLFDDVVVGGGGRYLVFHLPKLKKLAVFDVSEARVARYIPVPEDVKGRYAAGLGAVVVGLGRAGKLERWSLATGELEKSASSPLKEALASVVMGHGSNGPVVVNGQFFDLATFRPLPVTDPTGGDHPSIGPARTASADGTVFGAWNTHQSPASATAFVLADGTLKRHDSHDLLHVVPGPDGRTVFTGRGVVCRTMERASPDDAKLGYCLPAVRGDYFLSVTPASDGKGGGFTVYLRGIGAPIARLDKADHGLAFDGWDREEFGPWKRVFLVPDANVIAVLPASNDRVVLHPFDAEAALDKSGHEYLVVTSQPPREVRAGATLEYPVKVKAKPGGVAFRLDSGPKGMAVNADGVVTWAVPADAPAGDQEMILTVRDKTGREVFHTFSVRVSR